MTRIRRILVPTDFSTTADAALLRARDLAERLGASIHLLHVFEHPYTGGGFATDGYIPIPEHVRDSARHSVERLLAERMPPKERTFFGGTTEITYGTTARAIIDCAEAQSIDLIVMGTHGRTGLAHVLMGSVAEKVVRTAPCPVLTVREPQRYAGEPLATPATQLAFQ